MTEGPQGKYGVSVTLESVQGTERSVVHAAGEAIAKGQPLYIIYEEQQTGPEGAAAVVRNTLKISEGRIKLIRHGAVQSEQPLSRGNRCRDSIVRFIHSSISPQTRRHWTSSAKEDRLPFHGNMISTYTEK